MKQNKNKLKILWHEKSNYLAIITEMNPWPLLLILNDEYKGENPFNSYPIKYLKMFGWTEIGEI